MRLADLLARLPEASIESVRLTDGSCDIHNVLFLTEEGADSLLDDIIYFIDGGTLPARLPASRQFSFIVASGSEVPSEMQELPNVNLVRLAAETNPYSCYNVIQLVFVEEQKLTGMIRRLLDAHFSNHGLQNLIDEAASVLGQPIVVVDTTYRYIAYQLGDLTCDDSHLARVMEAEIANEIVLEQAIEYIRDEQIDSEIARSHAPYESYNSMLGCNTLTSAVMVRGVCVAHLMMLEHKHAFDHLEREVFVRLTEFVAQEMQKSEIWAPTSGEMGSFFLSNLISDRSISETVTRRRMKALAFHPKETFFVVCLHAPGEGLSQLQAEHVAGQLRPLLHHSLYTRYHQQLVLLLSRDYSDTLSEEAERKLHGVSRLNGLTVGVSNPFTEITDTGTAYDQARAAIRLGSRMSRVFVEQGVYHYGNLAYAHLLEIAGRRSDLLSLCHPSLLKLIEHDEAHKSELAETLFCYLQSGCSSARASQLLNLHKNTLLYRIGKAREILKLDLSSGEDQFILQIGFRILLGAGLFTPRLAYERTALRND